MIPFSARSYRIEADDFHAAAVAQFLAVGRHPIILLASCTQHMIRPSRHQDSMTKTMPRSLTLDNPPGPQTIVKTILARVLADDPPLDLFSLLGR